MNKKVFALVLSAFVITALATLAVAPIASTAPAMSLNAAQVEPTGSCGDGSPATADASNPQRVPPGCCSSNCTTDKDCNRICGKGNCVCIALNDCCRRCTY